MNFTQLSDGKTAKPVFIPKNVPIVAIRADDASDNFWLEYTWNTTQDGSAQNRSILVQGPPDAILAALDAQTTGSNTQLIAEKDAAIARSRLLAEEAQKLRARTRDLTTELALFQALENEQNWTQVQRMGTPILYSSTRLNYSQMAYERYFRQRLFSTALGSAGQGFSLMSVAHTNMKESGRVPCGMHYLVYGVKVELINCSDTFAHFLKYRMKLMWDFTQTNIDIGTLGTFEWDTTGRSGYLLIGSPPGPETPRAQLRKTVYNDDETPPVPTHPSEPFVPSQAALGEPFLVGGDELPPDVQKMLVEQAAKLLAPSASTTPPIPQPTQNNFFRYGKNGVQIPGNTTFAVIAVLSGVPDEEINDTRILPNDECVLRVTLAGYYPFEVEIG